MVERHDDPGDARTVRIRLTTEGTTRLDDLSHQHIEELGRLLPRMADLWAGLD